MNFFYAVNASVALPVTGGGISLKAYRASAQPTFSASQPIVVDFPASAASGDVCVVIVGDDNPSNTQGFILPSGWVLIDSRASSLVDVAFMAMVRVLDSTDISTGYVTINGFNSTTTQAGGYAYVFDGADTLNPIDAFQYTGGAGSTFNIAGITPNYTGSYVMAFYVFDGADGEPFTVNTSGWTREDDFDVPTSGDIGDVSLGWASKNALSISGTPTGNLSVTALTSDGWYAIMIAVKAQ